PKIQPFTFPTTPNVGERSGTICIVAAGDKPLIFTWFKDGKLLENEANVEISSSAGFSNLNFGSLTVNHSGNYTCSVQNDVGAASFTASLSVHSPPTWIQLPRDKTITAGSSEMLTCKASGFPSPRIEWFKTG
ncbi:unnamed protein product, partial [Ixodes hexagonus]